MSNAFPRKPVAADDIPGRSSQAFEPKAARTAFTVHGADGQTRRRRAIRGRTLSRPSLAPPSDEADWLGMLPRLRRYARVLAVQADAADELVARALARARRARLGAPPSALPVMAIMHRLHERGAARRAERTGPVSRAAAPGGHPVLDLLWQLPSPEREVLLLVAVERLAYADVAVLLDVPAATVVARLSHARAHLRGLMEPG